MLRLAPSTYFRHQAAQVDPTRRSARARRDEELRAAIRRVWDAHDQVYGTRKVWRQLRREGLRVALEWLPAYVPELNPAEYIWGHLKQHELPNLCPKNLWDSSAHVHRALRRMRRRPTLVRAFWIQAALFE